MAVISERISQRACDYVTRARHAEEISAFTLVNRDTGEVWEFEACTAHERVMSVSDVAAYGRPGRTRKPAGRPKGLAALPYLRWTG